LEFRVGVGEWWVDFFIKFLTQRRRGAEYAERLGEVGEWRKDVEKFMVASL